MPEPSCFSEPGVFDVSLGLFLCVGTLISFLPQVLPTPLACSPPGLHSIFFFEFYFSGHEINVSSKIILSFILIIIIN
jgi:hypothetical protein